MYVIFPLARIVICTFVGNCFGLWTRITLNAYFSGAYIQLHSSHHPLIAWILKHNNEHEIHFRASTVLSFVVNRNRFLRSNVRSPQIIFHPSYVFSFTPNSRKVVCYFKFSRMTLGIYSDSSMSSYICLVYPVNNDNKYPMTCALSSNLYILLNLLSFVRLLYVNSFSFSGNLNTAISVSLLYDVSWPWRGLSVLLYSVLRAENFDFTVTIQSKNKNNCRGFALSIFPVSLHINIESTV
jgi:hypothetical protein